MGLKLDVAINWLINEKNLKESIDKTLKSTKTSFADMGKMFDKNYLKSPAASRITANANALKKYKDVVEDLYATYSKLNKQNKLSYLLGTMFPFEGRQKTRLNEGQLRLLAMMNAPEEIAYRAWKSESKKKLLEQATTGTSAEYTEKKKETQKNERLISKEISGALKEYDKLSQTIEDEAEKNFALRMKRFLESSKESFGADLKAKQERDYYKKWYSTSEDELEALDEDLEYRKKEGKIEEEGNKNSKNTNILLRKILQGRWGAVLGASVAGAVAYGTYRILRKGFGYAYTTSQEGLDWQRTVSGGAAGGNWFGQGLAAYQRAGIGASQYQGFKRGVQGYLGSVKLGMGNAAPLMYLGLSALDNPDMLERQMEKALRRLPKDVSLAMAGQMGLDYNMWEAIYSGRLERERSFYSEEAMRQWAEVAKNLNDLITSFKVFFFNNLADPVSKLTQLLAHPDKVIMDRNSWLNRELESNYILTGLMPGLRSTVGALRGAVNVTVKVLGLPDGTQTQVTDTQFTFGSSES